MKKMLVIEDQEAFSSMLVTLVAERFGYESLSATSHAEASLILKEHSSDIFVAIVDLNLPDAAHGEGIDLVRGYHIPALVFTGEYSGELRDELISKGVADYTVKEGNHSIDYVINMVDRIYHNYSTKVLVVDDDKSAREMICALLKTQCFQTLSAASGEEALSILPENTDINLAIIDYQMSGMDGLCLTRRIRESYSSMALSIIGISSLGSKDTTIAFIKYGASDFILKPFEQEEFLTRINQVIGNQSITHQLDISNKQKNHLIGMASHDIRGPLGIVKNAAKQIRRCEDLSKINKLLDMIERQADQTLNYVEDILCLSAIEAGQLDIEMGNFNLSSTAMESIVVHRFAAEKKQQLVKYDLGNLEETEFDKERIRQAIDNLLSNAINYGPIGSDILIKTFEEDHHHVLEVTDQGSGIAADKLDNLYKPYVTLGSKTTGDEKSTGLGLSICKDIIDAHGGKLQYRNMPEGGSCFRFHLQMTTAPLVHSRV
ncbi:MAG: hybrid sensor histidine kinase/response regulator [Pseudomonadales bacterium]|nr:hybrid sensor histidine kinase/response regulator [Pseudomonadales bacterium]